MTRLAWLSLLLCACVTPPLLTCPEGRSYCGGACVDLVADPLACGAPMGDACDGGCVANASCVAGPGGASCLCDPGYTGASCAPCATCAVDQYLVAGCTPVADTQCAPLTVCSAGEFEAAPPTPTSDRACLACPPIPFCTQLSCTNPGDVVCLQCAPGFDGPSCAPTMMMLAAPDCYAILQASLSMGDGLYLVDVDGPGPSPAFQTYCDMTNGGWTLLNDQDVNVPPGYQDANVWRAGVTTTAPNGGQWGALSYAPGFMSIDGSYELRLTFGQDTTTSYVQWRQSGDPTLGMRGTLSAVAMSPAAQTSCAGPFAGLADEGAATAAWAGETGCGLGFAVGTSAAVSGGIPAYDGSAAGALVTDRVRLWVRANAP